MRTRWHIVNLGKLRQKGTVIRFSFVVPSYAKQLIGLYVFSPEMANLEPKNEDIQLSLLVNNEAQIPVAHSFSLGMNCIDDNILIGQVLKLNAPINKGERISGYVEKLSIPIREEYIEVKLYLKFEEYED